VDPNDLRILLISPRGTFFSREGNFARYVTGSREMRAILHYWNGVGAALPSVAALTPGRPAIRIIDENKEPIDFQQPWDIVGLTANTQQSYRAYEIAAEFRKRGSHVVMGGIHASVLPQETLGHVDTAIVGEAERTWERFIVDFARNTPREIYRQEGTRHTDMSQIPLPRYDLLSRYAYPVVWIQVSRGCPHDCEFCLTSTVYGRRHRHKTIAQTIREVREVRKYWKRAQIGFADDNLFVSRSFARELVEALRQENFTWFAQTDVGVAQDEEFLESLHKSGCRVLFVGFESVRQENLAGLDAHGWKAEQHACYPELIDAIQKHGIGVYGAFILGLDHDDPSVVDETVDFITRNHLLGAQITLLTPSPGTRVRQRLEGDGRILTNDWRLYTGWDAVVKHPDFEPGALEEALLRIYRSIYSPERLRERMRHFREIYEKLLGDS
jgi:radical SAM superfamily enzyme YgiQ (UPF0313 family)